MKYDYTSNGLLQIMLDINRLYLMEEELIDDGFISLERLQYLLNDDKAFSKRSYDSHASILRMSDGSK